MIICENSKKTSFDNLDIITTGGTGTRTFYITAVSERNGIKYPLFDSLMNFLEQEKAVVLSQLVFGNRSRYEKSISKMIELSASFDWPVTWLHGDTCSCDSVTSTVVTAVAELETKPVMLNGKKAGVFYRDAYAEYCYLGDIHGGLPLAPRQEQAHAAYEKMLSALESVGMNFTNVVRMWNYLDNLLDWYGEFNEMRTEFFHKHNVFSSMVPGGTGIGAGNPHNAAYNGELIAVKPLNSEITVRAVPSPMQCPAIDYKSSFSRAVEIASPICRYLTISGTASIDPDGHTVNINDTPAQIELTMQVVHAILSSCGMNWSDTVKSIAYFKDINDVPFFYDYLRKEKLPSFPVAVSHAAICRNDLLFELELDAVK